MSLRRITRSSVGAFILALTLLLSGCNFSTKVSVTLWDEQTMSAHFDLSAPQGSPFDAQTLCMQLAPLGQKLEPYEENGVVGCRAGGPLPVEALTGLSPDNELTEADGKLRFHMEDLMEMAPGEDESGLDGGMLMSVTFPGKVLEHSGASTVEGRTVTWTDPKDFEEGITAVSVMPNRIIGPILLTAAGLIAVVGSVALYVAKRPDPPSARA